MYLMNTIMTFLIVIKYTQTYKSLMKESLPVQQLAPNVANEY